MIVHVELRCDDDGNGAEERDFHNETHSDEGGAREEEESRISCFLYEREEREN